MKGRIFIVTLAAAALLSSSAFASNYYGPPGKPQGAGSQPDRLFWRL